MQSAAMLHFPYTFQPFIDSTAATDFVTSSSPLSTGSPSPPVNCGYANRCYDSIVCNRFRNHEGVSSRFTGLIYDRPKGYIQPIRKLFTIEAILGLNEDKAIKSSGPTIFTSTVENKDASPVVHASHSNVHHSTSVTSSTPRSSSKPSISIQKVSSCGGGKMKRIRTIFTPEQLERLELEFERQQYMVGPERMYLASSLGLSESQVKVWFQNRRIKFRKQHLEMQQARLAQIRETETGERETHEHDHPSKEVSTTHWEDVRGGLKERN